LKDIFILLGSNLNDPHKQLQTAFDFIQREIGPIVQKSSIYHSAPWGVSEQPDFLNQVLQVQTSLTAQQVLKANLSIEERMGRKREIKWGSRIIDIDILYFDHDIINDSNLKIPHPEIQNRRFTLIPLCEIKPDFIHPVLNVSNNALLLRCPDHLEVHQQKEEA
jgi:2-amino-4-hydroxy-6-hydroxymethyldihydropteridine diphosphokinase